MNIIEPSNKMLNDYIQNKLSDEQAEQLELYLVDHPGVLQDLEMDIMLKQGITEIKESSKSKNPFIFLDFFTSKRLIPLHFLAYGLAGFLLFNTFTNKEAIQTSSATFIELEKQRGLDTSVIEVQTQNNKNIVLRFFPDSMIEKYTLQMQSESSKQKIEFKDLQADDFGSITVTLNNNNLSGKWEILISNHSRIEIQKYIVIIMEKII